MFSCSDNFKVPPPATSGTTSIVLCLNLMLFVVAGGVGCICFSVSQIRNCNPVSSIPQIKRRRRTAKLVLQQSERKYNSNLEKRCIFTEKISPMCAYSRRPVHVASIALRRAHDLVERVQIHFLPEHLRASRGRP